MTEKVTHDQAIITFGVQGFFLPNNSTSMQSF